MRMLILSRFIVTIYILVMAHVGNWIVADYFFNKYKICKWIEYYYRFVSTAALIILGTEYIYLSLR